MPRKSLSTVVILTMATLRYFDVTIAFSVPPIPKSKKIPSCCRLSSTLGDENGPVGTPSLRHLSESEIEGLDLVPLMHQVARHAGTRRGHQALLSLVHEDHQSLEEQLLQKSTSQSVSSRKQWAELATSNLPSASKTSKTTYTILQMATSATEARHEYELIEAASLALRPNDYGLEVPPIYGKDSDPFDTDTIPTTDDDDWLYLPAHEWTLQDILLAEQVMQTLERTKSWAHAESIQTWMPNLAAIGASIDPDNRIPAVLDEVRGKVEIVRVRSLTDPEGKASFQFRLRVDEYPVLRILREKEARLLERGGKALDREVQDLEAEINEVDSQIRNGLAQLVLSVSPDLDAGIDRVARLDVLFARAAFGKRLGGVIPIVSSSGREIQVPRFVHPVLATAKTGKTSAITTPVDLALSPDTGKRALIISSPNGGGKTLSMKAFGLASIMTKLGIPIPLQEGAVSAPQIGFVDEVLLNVGDRQSVMDGESTWTSILNSCSRMLERIQEEPKKRFLVLLDELGSGTDPEAGGAVAQALLEEFLDMPYCSLIATTHSPRLKTLSYESPDVDCATVLLQRGEGDYDEPTFRLEYGIIGESYAIAAAARCTPSLPASVLARASQLLSSDSPDATSNATTYLDALTNSMREQLARVKEAQTKADELTNEARGYQRAMKKVAASSESDLNRLEKRLEDYFQRLRDDNGRGEVELVGDTLDSLRLVKKEVQSQQELLKERGLKLLPTSYKLQLGESVVVISNTSQFDGATFEVVADSTIDQSLGPMEVLVRQSSMFSDWENALEGGGTNTDPIDAMEEHTWIFSRYELAIWDYDSVWENDDMMGRTPQSSTPDASKRLNSILSSLSSSDSSDRLTSSQSGFKPSKEKASFFSARARKSASKVAQKSKKKKKK